MFNSRNLRKILPKNALFLLKSRKVLFPPPRPL